MRVLFVDDGSTDATRAVLGGLVEQLGEGAALLALDVNRGKAEAVRAGLQRAMAEGAHVVGYYDADGATPASEMRALFATLEREKAAVALGSRVALLGRHIERRLARHYAGRVFATVASITLGLPVYDTQCGAKFFVVTPLLRAVLDVPFSARWAFDVELLSRLLQGAAGLPGLKESDFIEMPLRAWADVAGSTLTWKTYPRVMRELGLIWGRAKGDSLLRGGLPQVINKIKGSGSN